MNVFIAGATGYIGRHLVPELLQRGHTVRALVRRGSEKKLARGAEPILGNPLDASTFVDRLAPSDTFIQLVGVPHPSPAKAAQFRTVDLVAIRESVRAVLLNTSVEHFIYLSVAQPAPVMRAYLEVRAEGERLLRASGTPSTFVRPFYVLGPGHWWPYAVLPLFWLFAPEHLWPVKLHDVVRVLADAVEQRPQVARIIEVPEIRAAGSPARPAVTTAPSHPRP